METLHYSVMGKTSPDRVSPPRHIPYPGLASRANQNWGHGPTHQVPLPKLHFWKAGTFPLDRTQKLRLQEQVEVHGPKLGLGWGGKE